MVLKKLCKCVYFLVKHKIAYTTVFVPLVDLLIECNDQDLSVSLSKKLEEMLNIGLLLLSVS